MGMPKIRPETAAKRQIEILEAAYRAFSAHGIDVSVDQICAEAGVSKGTFYGYFESKDAIILALAQKHRADIRMLGDVDRVEGLASQLLSYGHGGSPATSRFELEAWTYSLSHPDIREIFQANLAELDRSIAHALSHVGDTQQDPPQILPEEGARILRIFTAGMMAVNAIDGRSDGFGMKQATRQIVRLISNSTLAKEPKGGG